MRQRISIILPAWNEAERIGETLRAIREGELRHAEVIVVDDGSDDRTAEAAAEWADRVIRHERNIGKGAALETGWRSAEGEVLLFLDADLGPSARHAARLLAPIERGEADMVVAVLPAPRKKGGFGLARGMASRGIYWLSGYRPTAPLSGQRAVKKCVLERIGGLAPGFGIEVSLTIDAVRHGFRIAEVEVPFRHRETGRDWQGFCHRGRQLVHIGRTLIRKWQEPAW
jgi:glycosyltransferase involved in cell wall biosynthesis